MSKDQTVTRSSNAFSLNRLRTECHYASVTADFTVPPSVNKVSNSIMPAFLVDSNFFTPAFIVSREKEYYVNNSLFEKEKFQARILKAHKLCQDSNDLEQSTQEISPPVPTSNYCQICKTGFSVYQDHLKEASHLRQTRFSKANIYIAQLCKIYSKNRLRDGVKEKKKGIKKTQGQKKCRRKAKCSRVEKEKVQMEIPQTTKHQNCSTNVPSLLPTPYC